MAGYKLNDSLAAHVGPMHHEIPGMECFCLVCAGKRAADRRAVVEAMANIDAMNAVRKEIAENGFGNWRPKNV